MDSSPELALFENSIKETLRKNSQTSEYKMSSIAFDTWFSDIHIISFDEEKVVLATKKEIVKDVIMKRYKDFFFDGVREALGFDCKIELTCDRDPSSDQIILRGYNDQKRRSELYEDDGEYEEFSSGHYYRETFGEEKKPKTKIKCIGINPEFTFDNFVVGSSNNLAYASSKAVAQDPAGTHGYNPLFIYGPSGLGKTHLMYAIANEVHRKYPQKSIICIKSEDFLNELIDCMGKKQMPRFKEKYRNVDMLMIDDIQFISGKDSIQVEFFHTFDALYEAKKQIVITSDRPPRELYILKERIQQRLTQGMLVDVQPPEYELRLAILKKKAEKINLDIPTNVLVFLAEKLNSNIREIEGALKKIGANAFLCGQNITLEWVKGSMPEYFRESKPVTETVNLIIEVTARKYDVSVEDILGKSRTKDIKTARNVAMYICKTVLGMSLPAIGRMLNRDYSTVHSNIATIESEMELNDKLNNEVMEIIAEIKS